MATGQIHITLPGKLILEVDKAAQEEFATRSEFIRLAIVERLRVISEHHAKLTALAHNADLATEDELFDLLRLKRAQRAAAQWRREQRRKPTTRGPGL